MDLNTKLLISICFITATSLLIHIYHMIRNEHFKVNICGYIEFENLTPFQQMMPPLPKEDRPIEIPIEKVKDTVIDIGK